MYVKNKNEKDNLVKHLMANQNIEAHARRIGRFDFVYVKVLFSKFGQKTSTFMLYQSES